MTAPGLLACSGPGAADAIAASQAIAFAAVLFSLLAAVVIIKLGRSRRRWVALPAVLVHPGWWLSVTSGDCGYMSRWVSAATTAGVAVVTAWVIWRSRVKLQRRG